MDKCPDCHKFWETTWKGEKFCPQCGQRPDQVKIQPRIQTQREKAFKTHEEIWAKILSDPTLGFAYRLARKMFLEHGYDFEERKTIAFRNRQTSYEQSGKICFGYSSLRHSHDNGFREYKTIQWQTWGNMSDLVGLKGVWAEVIHEFAHVVQEVEDRLYSKNGHSNKYHNEQFVEIANELQILFPFEEVQNL